MILGRSQTMLTIRQMTAVKIENRLVNSYTGIQFPNGPWVSGMEISSSTGLKKNPKKLTRGKKKLASQGPIQKSYNFGRNLNPPRF